MDFLSIKDEASKFIAAQAGCKLKISSTDADSSRIDITTDNGLTFYISYSSEDTCFWTVWSENEASLQYLQPNMELLKLDACKSISGVLQSVSQLVAKKAPGNSNFDEDEHESDDADDDDNNDDEDDDDDDYYMQEDVDAENDDEVGKYEKEDDLEVASNFFNSKGSQTAIVRLVKDLKLIQKSKDFGISGQPRGNNLFMWDIELTDIPADTKLGTDLAAYQKRFKEKAAIKLDVQFPSEYPFQPPFIRVLKPRFKFLTGHITIGGSICMQALTKSGWCPANDLESILIQVRTEILSDPKACLDPVRPNVEYQEAEARDAFNRMVQKYGWS